MMLHPRSDAQLGVTVARCRVDMVDAVAQQHFERAVGIVLTDSGERRCAEHGERAQVTVPSKCSSFDHVPIPVLRAVDRWRSTCFSPSLTALASARGLGGAFARP